MRAVQMIARGEPLQMREVRVPVPRELDVLVRVRAAGICHSDAHYRAGKSIVEPLPLTLGHEVAGIVERVGANVSRFKPGDRVCVHYLATCGHCAFCERGNEQFCASAKMIGKYRDGGYAEFLLMPECSLFALPAEIPFEHGAVMMCSSATSLHALKKARLKCGETVAIFGMGGLGLSAAQLAKILGAGGVFAVDIHEAKLAQAEQFGCVPVNAAREDAVRQIQSLTGGRGVDVALELIGLPRTMRQAVQSLAVQGRAALAGITQQSFEIFPYQEILNKEAEIVGVSDHLATELPLLLDWARAGQLDLQGVITKTIPLDAAAINQTLDALDRFEVRGRTVIKPGN